MSTSGTSSSKTQWLLILAGACAAFGLLLKVSDLFGPAEEPTTSHQDARQTAPRRAGDATAPEPAPGHPGATDDGLAGSGPGAAAAVRRSGKPEEWFGSGALATESSKKLSPRAIARQAKREARARARVARKEAVAAVRAGGTGQEAGRVPGGVAGHSPGGGVGSGAGQAAGQPVTAPTVPPGADLVFDSGAEAQYATDKQVEVPGVDKLAGPTGSISFWMQPGWGEGNQDDASLVALSDNRLQVIKNVNYLRFEFTDDNGVGTGIGAPITDWQAGEWHQVTTTWDGRVYSLYIDGRLVTMTTHEAPFNIAEGTKLFIGSSYPESRPVAPGMIGSVDVRNRPLAPGEVANQFARTYPR